jgi:RNA polymerase primary sigma factor
VEARIHANTQPESSRPFRRIDAGGDYVLRLYLRDLAAAGVSEPADLSPKVGQGQLDDSARERLVLSQLHRVVRIAFDYKRFGLSLCDLVSEGNLGLLRAAELYDPLRNVRFSYYARPWIRVQMQRALSYQAWPVSSPADFSWRHSQVQLASERLTATFKRPAQDSEVAEACGLKLPAVRRLRSSPALLFVPLNSPWPGNETGLSLAEVILDENSPRPDVQAASLSDFEFAQCLLAVLTPREQQVIRLHFGLDDGGTHTLAEIGGLLGYVRQGIHRIESVALAKMRRHARFLHIAATRKES